jgi:dCMP deaminase
MKQEDLDKMYLEMAETLGKRSYATRKKVGCLVVKDTHIIAEGMNGTPKGFDNCCEYSDHVGHIYTKGEVLHAEENALAKLARSTNSSLGADLYVTLAPCFQCAKMIIACGIKRVVYSEKYFGNQGTPLLRQAGIEVVNLLPAEELMKHYEEGPTSYYGITPVL